jgi:hypothetical protein
MRTLLQLAAVLALIAFGVGAACVSYDVHKLLLTANAVALHADGVLLKAQGEWQNEKADVHQILTNGKEATTQAALFATEQRKQLQKTSRDSDNQVRSLGLVTRNAEKFFYNLDQQLSAHVLPDFDRELVATSTAAQFSFASLTKASDAMALQINDPAIAQTLEAFNLAAHNLSLAAGNGNSILAHGDHVAAYYDKKLTTPLGFWKTFLKTSLSVGSQAGNISAGFIK